MMATIEVNSVGGDSEYKRNVPRPFQLKGRKFGVVEIFGDCFECQGHVVE